MIPCIETKCLKYPVCKHKRFITCNLLRDCYDVKPHDKSPKLNLIWIKGNIQLKNKFPNLIGVQRYDSMYRK